MTAETRCEHCGTALGEVLESRFGRLCWHCYHDATLPEERVEAASGDGQNGAQGEASDNGAELWLAGEPMDPEKGLGEPLSCLAGFPFLHAAAGATVVGPTGGGRSSLLQACAYDAARAGLRVAYLGSEVSYPEFLARARHLAEVRGDELTPELREELGRVRYLNLAPTLGTAWQRPSVWVQTMAARYDVVGVDPLSAVASALDFNFDRSNAEYVSFYERLVRPLTAAGPAVVLLDNVGHDPDAQKREQGVSAKGNVADLRFACANRAAPVGLIVTCRKVRTVRAPFAFGDQWVFDRDTQRVTAHEGDVVAPRFRPTGLMQKVSRLLEQASGLGAREIREAIPSKAEHVDAAIAALVEELYVEVDPPEPKKGQKVRHNSVRAYREPPG